MLSYGPYLVANFPGYGLYEYKHPNDESLEFVWSQLTPNDTAQALITRYKYSGFYILYADFGTQGLWK
jgi:hypothetical protein